MRTKMSLPRVLLLLLTLLGSVMSAKSGSVLLREGLYTEEVEGDLDAAIEIYQQVLDTSDTPKNLVAQALYRQGMCYVKRQNESAAQQAFSRLVSQHPDQTALIEKVQPLLAQMGSADPAGLMPPETLMYLELGSPGRQIETVVKMLKGTPFENPLAALSEAAGAGHSSQQGPAQMLNALLNPSMMAEFKKIRGIGIGIQALGHEDEPEAIIVLFPGDSDALRGLIVAALGFAGQSVQSIEGMNVVNLPQGACAAYDDTVVIVSTPSEQAMRRLEWSVKQYKSAIDGPTLASSNKSFAKIKKQTRRNNALTLWVNVNETYSKMVEILPADAIPQELRVANSFADFKNIDDMIASLSIGQAGMALEANVNLKDGHNCLAYNMIRTPSLSTEAMQNVPADTFALLSLALGEPGTPQADAISKQIKSGLGLDIGDQLFANIDQIALFVVPVQEGLGQEDGIPPQAKSVGLAITSDDPAQTRELLLTMLRQANMVAHESEPVGGKYAIQLANGPTLHGYLDQAGKTMVLSLNPAITEMSSTAMAQHASAVDRGPLKSILSRLPKATSKLALVNLAGVIRFINTAIDLPANEQGDHVRENLMHLAEASENATIRLATSEEDNSLSVRLNVSGLPPIGKIFGPIMQIAQMMDQLEGSQNHWSISTPPIVISQVIDNDVDASWDKVKARELKNSFYEPPASEADLSATYKALWDKDNLYVLVDVTDDQRSADSGEFWQDDGIEIFIDADNTKSSTYGPKDYQYYFSYEGDSLNVGESKHDNTVGVKVDLAGTEHGYRAKIRFPWSTLGVKPGSGVSIGLDVQVNDDDDGEERDSKIAWNAVTDDAWVNPQLFGTIQLGGLVAWWKLDETNGTEASDASGNGQTAYLRGNPKWLPTGGKINGALELDGEDDYVETGNTTHLPLWTVATWVKSPAAPSSAEENGPIHREQNYQINWDHAVEEFRGGAGVGVDNQWFGASFGDLEAGTWYHLAATYDGEILKAYTNGALVSENYGPSGPADAHSATLKLGRHATRGGCFAGTIDDVRIYNTVLGPAEIAALAGKR